MVRSAWLRRRARAIPGRGAHSSVSISGVAASDEESIRLLRAALLFGSGRRRARGIQLSRAAARRRCPDGGHCTHVRSTCGAVRSSPLVSRVEMFVIVSSVRSRSPVRRSCGCFEASWHSRALWFGERSVARPYNNQMEPSRRAVCAIMSPSARLIWRFRRSEKHSAKQTKSEACGMVHVRRRGTWSSQAQSTTRIRFGLRGFDDPEMLSLEDVPPKSIGGKPLVLTCRACNNRFGHLLDVNIRSGRDLREMAEGKREAWIKLSHEGHTITAKAMFSPGGSIRIAGVPEKSNPKAHQSLFKNLDEIVARGSLDWDFTIGLASRHNKWREGVGWLRVAYLYVFAALGYNFILRPELNVVREQFQRPDDRVVPQAMKHT